MKTKTIRITDQRSKVHTYNDIEDLPDTGEYEVIIRKRSNSRTIQQNRALHLWLAMLACAMEKAGISNRQLFSSLREGFEIPPTMDTVKEIVNKVSKDRYDGRSTSKLTTVEIQELYEICNNAFAQSLGISIPWPSCEPPPFGTEPTK